MNRVAVYADNGFNSEVDKFSCMECVVNKVSRVLNAPIEGGRKSIDNKVLDPITIKMTGKIVMSEIGGPDSAGELTSMYANRDFEFYSVTTKDSAYDNLMLQNMISRDMKDEFDTVEYVLEFTEALIVQGSGKICRDEENENYQVGGFVNPIIREGLKVAKK